MSASTQSFAPRIRHESPKDVDHQNLSRATLQDLMQPFPFFEVAGAAFPYIAEASDQRAQAQGLLDVTSPALLAGSEPAVLPRTRATLQDPLQRFSKCQADRDSTAGAESWQASPAGAPRAKTEVLSENLPTDSAIRTTGTFSDSTKLGSYSNHTPIWNLQSVSPVPTTNDRTANLAAPMPAPSDPPGPAEDGGDVTESNVL